MTTSPGLPYIFTIQSRTMPRPAKSVEEKESMNCAIIRWNLCVSSLHGRSSHGEWDQRISWHILCKLHGISHTVRHESITISRVWIAIIHEYAINERNFSIKYPVRISLIALILYACKYNPVKRLTHFVNSETD